VIYETEEVKEAPRRIPADQRIDKRAFTDKKEKKIFFIYVMRKRR
jgi:hypothetical protein